MSTVTIHHLKNWDLDLNKPVWNQVLPEATVLGHSFAPTMHRGNFQTCINEVVHGRGRGIC